MTQHVRYRTIVLGAGAAGLMCAAHAGPDVLVLDHAKAPGEKIRISGGGRCNFTNLRCGPGNFLSANPHFAKSALSRYTAADFVALVDRHAIPWHEKARGQLFCDRSARDIVAMLRAEMGAAQLWLQTQVIHVAHDGAFVVTVEREGIRRTLRADQLVLATGGLSIPKMGATGLAYRIAAQFGLPVLPTRAGLVPLTFSGDVLEGLRALAGVAAPARVTTGGTHFDEALLYTHRGLSGPAILQASSYWDEGAALRVDLDPHGTIRDALRATRHSAGRRAPATALAQHLPQRLAQALVADAALPPRLADCPDRLLDNLLRRDLRPAGTEGYRTAEVTLGGIDTAALDSRTMQARAMPGLFAIGEAVDVTGWLGGYNFQWAWSSGWAAGQAIAGA